MIGKHKGWAVWFFAAVLLVYNTFRAALTWWVSLLRDQEERSGYTPSWSWWNGYRLASTVHRYGMVPLVGVGITLAAIHGYHALHYGVVYLQR